MSSSKINSSLDTKRQIDPQFKQKIQSLEKLMMAQQKDYQEILKIQEFIQEHKKCLENEARKKKDQMNNIQAQLLQISSISKKYQKTIEELSCSYNKETKGIYDKIILKHSAVEQIENCKRKTSQLIKKVQFSRPNTDLQVSIKDQKLNKLQKLFQKADKTLSQREEFWEKPLQIESFFENFEASYDSELNFILVAGWMINLVLGYKDDSECSDTLLEKNIVKNYRQWLLINGWGTFAITILATLFFILDKFPFEKNHPKRYRSKKEQESRFRKWGVNAILSPIVLVARGLKSVWILYGIILFLNFMDLSKCSGNLIGYCTIEFIIFLVIFVYYFVKYGRKLFNWLKLKLITKFKCSSKLIKHDEYYSFHDLDQENTQRLNLYHENLGTNCLIYGNSDDLSDMLTKLSIWTVVGWTYNLFILIKDNSQCLDHNLAQFPFTYRQWVALDGAITLTIFGLVLILGIVSMATETRPRIWSDQNRGLYRIELGCFIDHFVQKIVVSLLFLAFLARVACIIFGLAFFFVYVDFGKDKFNDNVFAFTIAYFTEWVYIILQGSAFLIKGEIAKRLLRNVEAKNYTKIKSQSHQKLSTQQPQMLRQIQNQQKNEPNSGKNFIFQSFQTILSSCFQKEV